MNIEVSPDKEYEALRQDILKKTEYNFQLLNINLTLMAAFLGFGMNDNRIAMLLPPIELIVLLLLRANQLDLYRISLFIVEKYEWENSKLSWERYFHQSVAHPKNTLQHLLGMGTFGVFALSPIIATIVGMLGFEKSLSQYFLIGIDFISILLIIIIFILTRYNRLTRLTSR